MLLRIICALLLASLPFVSYAGCHVVLGYGEAKVAEKKIKTKNFEDKLIALPFVEGAYEKNGKSNPYTFGGGCRVFQYMWFELTYRDHFEAAVHSRYRLEGFGYRSEEVDVIRSLEVHGPTLAAVFEIPVYHRFSLIAKAGAMKGTGYMSVKIPAISGEYTITKKEERILPVAGLGILIRLTQHVSIAVEHEQFNNDFRYTSANLRYRF